MEPTKLSTLITDLQELLKEHGDGFIETYGSLAMPYAFWVEDDKQYYMDATEDLG